jgi:hypothetical protein
MFTSPICYSNIMNWIPHKPYVTVCWHDWTKVYTILIFEVQISVRCSIFQI